MRTFTGHASPVYGCAFSPDGRWVMAATRLGSALPYFIVTGVVLFIFTRLAVRLWEAWNRSRGNKGHRLICCRIQGSNAFSSSPDSRPVGSTSGQSVAPPAAVYSLVVQTIPCAMWLFAFESSLRISVLGIPGAGNLVLDPRRVEHAEVRHQHHPPAVCVVVPKGWVRAAPPAG